MADEDLPDSSLDQIRNILFGEQSREFSGRMGRLEERLARDFEALREDLNARLDTLQAESRAAREAAFEELRESSVTRAQLASLFERIARELGDEGEG